MIERIQSIPPTSFSLLFYNLNFCLCCYISCRRIWKKWNRCAYPKHSEHLFIQNIVCKGAWNSWLYVFFFQIYLLSSVWCANGIGQVTNCESSERAALTMEFICVSSSKSFGQRVWERMLVDNEHLDILLNLRKQQTKAGDESFNRQSQHLTLTTHLAKSNRELRTRKRNWSQPSHFVPCFKGCVFFLFC